MFKMLALQMIHEKGKVSNVLVKPQGNTQICRQVFMETIVVSLPLQSANTD